MARQRHSDRHDPLKVRRTRISSAWLAVIVALVFLILLIIFIAQNNRSEPLHFLGASGRVSEALALVVAAIAGALLVVLIGTARLLQLRLAARRHNRAARRGAAAASAESGDSAPASAQRETQSVETERKS